MRTQNEIVGWARSHGSDARDVRDAAHEASHALQVGARQWDRESIHQAVARAGLASLVVGEIEARAVERLVCNNLEVEHEWAHFEFLAKIEALKSGVRLPDNLSALIGSAMTRRAVVARANLILGLSEKT